MTKLDGNDDLDQLIQDVVKSTDQLQELKSLTGSESEEDDAGEAPAQDSPDTSPEAEPEE